MRYKKEIIEGAESKCYSRIVSLIREIKDLGQDILNNNIGAITIEELHLLRQRAEKELLIWDLLNDSLKKYKDETL